MKSERVNYTKSDSGKREIALLHRLQNLRYIGMDTVTFPWIIPLVNLSCLLFRGRPHLGHKALISGGLSPYLLKYSLTSLPSGSTMNMDVFSLSESPSWLEGGLSPTFNHQIGVTTSLRSRSLSLLLRSTDLSHILLFPKNKKTINNTGTAIRDRTRSIKKRVLEIAKVLKRRTGDSVQEVRRITGEMADIAEKTLQAGREVVQHLHQNAQHIGNIVRAKQQRLTAQLENFLNLGEQVLRQARQVNAGQLNLPERVVSIFDPDARPIRRGKAHKENEFGYNVCLTESAERLVTTYSVKKGNPPDKELLVPGVDWSGTGRRCYRPRLLASGK